MSVPDRAKKIAELFEQKLPPEEMQQQVLDLLLSSLASPIAVALSRCALPHWFDEPILAVLLDDNASLSPASILEKIATLSFVRPREGGGYLLHEKVRARLLQPWHTERAEQYRELSRRLWYYFSSLTVEEDKVPFVIQAETLYHDLAADPEEAFPRFQKTFETTLEQWHLTQAEHLLQLGEEQGWILGDTNHLWLAYHGAELSLKSSDYTQALKILGDLSAQPLSDKLKGRVLLDIGSSLRKTGKKDEAKQNLQQALAIQRDIDDLEGLADTLDQLADFHLIEQNFDQARTYAQEALAIAESLEDKRKIASVLRGMGAIYRQSGKEEKALEYYQKSLDIRRALNDEWGISDCLNSLALIHLSRKEYEQALTNLNQSLETAERLGDLAGMVVHLKNISNVYVARKKYEQALQHLTRAVEIAQKIGDFPNQMWTLHEMGNVFKAQGEHTQALEHYQRALALKEKAEDVGGQGITLHEMGNVYQAQGEHTQALEHYQRALALYEKAEDVRGQGVTIYEMGRVLRSQNNLEQALDHFQRALAMQEQVGDLREQSLNLHAMGNVFKAQGDNKTALSYYERALTILEARFGPDHPDTRIAQQSFAALNQDSE